MGSNARKRQKKISFRVTEEEAQSIQAIADQCSLSTADYCRKLSLGYEPKSTLDAQAIQELAKLNGDLGRLGGLLKMWLSGSDGQNLNISELLEDISALQSDIKGKVLKL